MPIQSRPKSEKRKYFLRIHGWGDDPPTHQDPVWHAILDTLVHQHCYYTIESNTSIDAIQQSDYKGVLGGAKITESFYWMYPKREKTTHTGLHIFGKVQDLETRGLKHLSFCESFGAESLTIEEPQNPLLYTVQDQDHPLVQLHLTMEQAQTLRKSLNSKSLQLLSIPPYDDWAWGEIPDSQVFCL